MARIVPVVFGHEDVLSSFLRAVGGARLHHAWLLHGMQGVGKSMLANLMAASYLCKALTKDGPCGDCHSCRIIAAGAHPDLRTVKLEDGKRDISIAQVRQMISFLSLSGSESNNRVIVLQDAEQMNVQASNALLKGLEEPAPGSLLLIVCNDLMRIPATIRSRCMLQHCAPLNDQDMHKAVSGMDIDEDFSDLVLRLAHGCPGRVQCLQDRRIGEALKEWQQITLNTAKADLGHMQDWIGNHLDSVPHELVAEIVLEGIQDWLFNSTTNSKFPFGVLNAMAELANWPQAIRRHSLKPATALFAHMMQLRMALKEAN